MTTDQALAIALDVVKRRDQAHRYADSQPEPRAAELRHQADDVMRDMLRELLTAVAAR